MARYGRPQMPEQRFGKEIERIRITRNLFRTDVVARIYRDFPYSEHVEDSFSEDKLTRLEKGKLVKVPRSLIELLLAVLDCTVQERMSLLLLADRSTFPHDGDADSEADNTAVMLTLAMKAIYPEARQVLQLHPGSKGLLNLETAELLELVVNAIELTIQQYHS